MANQTITVYPAAKRRRIAAADDHHHSLLPGLPDHIAHLCLSLISPSALYSVCRSWRRLIYSVSFPPFRSLYTLSLPSTAAVDGGQLLTLSSFDPISSKWITIDSPPYHHHLSLRHPSFMSRSLPIQSVSVSGNLLLLAATSLHRNIPIPAFSHPLIFNPLSNTWSSCPPLSTPRRWCAAGALQETVVVASGIGSHYTETVARSVEKWVCRKIESLDKKHDGNWKKIQALNHLKLKIESFDEKSYGNWEKIQSLNDLKLEIESFDEKDYGNWKKIQCLNNLKLKVESFDEKDYGNWEKIQSFNDLKLKIESFDEKDYGNWKKIQCLNNLKLKVESFDEKDYGNWEKIQSFNDLKLKIESFDEKDYGNWEKIQSLNDLKLKIESLDEKDNGNWEKLKSLKHSKLCREAIDAVGWKSKLCMVNVKGDCAKEGFVYNVDTDEWGEMPVGMLGGWKGPTTAMDEETMYVVDESRGVLRTYNEEGDEWSEVVEDERLKGAECIAAGGGRVCVVSEMGVGIVVVDVVATPPRLWVVETPPGHDIVSLHILPRMCPPEFQSSPVTVSESKE